MTQPTLARRAGRRAAILACTAAAAALAAPRPAGAAPPGPVPLRDLYDEAGAGPSALARRLAGQRIAVRGLVGPAPDPAADWFALGETALVPCQMCGGRHDWPAGVLAVHAPGAPHLRDPFSAVTLEGVLDATPEAGAPAGLPERLALRDATVLSA